MRHAVLLCALSVCVAAAVAAAPARVDVPEVVVAPSAPGEQWELVIHGKDTRSGGRGADVSPPLQVQVKMNSEPAQDVVVRWECTGAGPTGKVPCENWGAKLAGSLSVTDKNGIASMGMTLGTVSAPYYVSAVISRHREAPRVQLTGVIPPPPYKTTIVQGNEQVVPPNTVAPVALIVQEAAKDDPEWYANDGYKTHWKVTKGDALLDCGTGAAPAAACDATIKGGKGSSAVKLHFAEQESVIEAWPATMKETDGVKFVAHLLKPDPPMQ